MPVSKEILDEIALSPAEYDMIVDRLDREPNPVELGMFGALWSEHCGYKHSRPLLGMLPTRSARTPVPGRRRKRRRHRHRQRPGRRVQGGVPQPSLGRGAVAGRGHRRRWNSSRHPGHGRAAYRPAQFPAFRPARLRRQPSAAAGCGGRHRLVWELHRRPPTWPAKSTSATATRRTRWSTPCAWALPVATK